MTYFDCRHENEADQLFLFFAVFFGTGCRKSTIKHRYSTKHTQKSTQLISRDWSRDVAVFFSIFILFRFFCSFYLA